MTVSVPQSTLASTYPERRPHLNFDLLGVIGLALGVRLLFLGLAGNTYDYDEFVLLLLGRDVAHGAVPYRDFMFFHPPGMLILLSALEPITHIWWPVARIIMAGVDTLSAVLVWRIGSTVFGRREGLAAAVLYALSPLALISSTRVGQDPVITLLGLAGLYVLITTQSQRAAILAGVCLALAIWVKYPAAYFLPIYLLVAPRRTAAIVVAALLTIAALLVPLHANLPALYHQTLAFQWSRWSMAPSQRLATLGLFWLAVSPFAAASLLWRRQPPWLVAGFLLGGLFVFSSQVYYHYFVVVVPFAALLGAPFVVRFLPAARPLVAAIALCLTAGLALLIDRGGSSPLFVTAAHLSDIAPTVHAIDARTSSTDPVLADRDEYAYLAGRPALAHYFWNEGVLVDGSFLENRLQPPEAVVLSYGASSGFPPGFVQYLDRRSAPQSVGVNTVWFLK
ncbi:MAG: ArnT family glycosyltransferase [Chloroflexota bacterium]